MGGHGVGERNGEVHRRAEEREARDVEGFVAAVEVVGRAVGEIDSMHGVGGVSQRVVDGCAFEHDDVGAVVIERFAVVGGIACREERPEGEGEEGNKAVRTEETMRLVHAFLWGW
ncbi:MAG: hypothetical protein AAF799_12705 [Myxococcota bacterium]